MKKIIQIVVIFMCINAMAQDTKITFYGHTGYTSKFNRNPNSKPQGAFNMGGLDILATSQLSEKFTILAEIFTGFRGDGATGVDISIERLYIKYAANDFLNVRFGRMYTPLSFWQNRYSQAQFLQPTINAPYAIRTKMDKGILPTNSVGIQLDGDNIGKLRFGYFLLLDNTSGAPSLNTDITIQKALTLKLKIEPIEDLQIYGSARRDIILKNMLSVSGNKVNHDITQTILNMGAVHITPMKKLEAAFDYFHVINDIHSLGSETNNFMYFYLGYKINKLTPYIQGDLLRFSGSREYYTPNNLTGLVVGARYSVLSNLLVKLEYKFRNTPLIKHEDVLSAQISAYF